jgi:hypothetical protein
MLKIRYKPTLGPAITRRFSTEEQAKTWCRMIGRPDLIHRLVECVSPRELRTVEPLHKCAGAHCPGLPWRASQQPHPASCATSSGFRYHVDQEGFGRVGAYCDLLPAVARLWPRSVAPGHERAIDELRRLGFTRNGPHTITDTEFPVMLDSPHADSDRG